MRDEILDLKHAVQSAKDWLNEAGTIASRMSVDDDGKPNGWKEIDAVADKLASITNSMAGILDPIADAIKAAEEYADHMSDLADGQSY